MPGKLTKPLRLDFDFGIAQLELPGARAHFQLRLLAEPAFEFGGSAAQCCQRQLRFDASEQLARSERLDEVAVGARAESLDPRFLSGASGDENHRNRVEVRVS